MKEIEFESPKVRELTASSPKVNNLEVSEAKITPIADLEPERARPEKMKTPEMSEPKLSFPDQRPSTSNSDKSEQRSPKKVKELNFSGPKVQSLQSETKVTVLPLQNSAKKFTESPRTDREANRPSGSMNIPDFDDDRHTSSFSASEPMIMPEFDTDSGTSSKSTTFAKVSPMDRLASVLEDLVAGMQNQEEFQGEPMPQFSNVFGRSDSERTMTHYGRS